MFADAAEADSSPPLLLPSPPPPLAAAAAEDAIVVVVVVSVEEEGGGAGEVEGVGEGLKAAAACCFVVRTEEFGREKWWEGLQTTRSCGDEVDGLIAGDADAAGFGNDSDEDCGDDGDSDDGDGDDDDVGDDNDDDVGDDNDDDDDEAKSVVYGETPEGGKRGAETRWRAKEERGRSLKERAGELYVQLKAPLEHKLCGGKAWPSQRGSISCIPTAASSSSSPPLLLRGRRRRRFGRNADVRRQ